MASGSVGCKLTRWLLQYQVTWLHVLFVAWLSSYSCFNEFVTFIHSSWKTESYTWRESSR